MKRAGELLEEPTGFDAYDAPAEELEAAAAELEHEDRAKAEALWRAGMRERIESVAARIQAHEQRLDAIEEGIRRLQRKATRAES